MAEKNTITVLYDKAQDSPGIVSKPSHDSFLGQANNVRELEGIRVIGMSDEECDFFHSFTPEMRKRLNHKVCVRPGLTIETVTYGHFNSSC